MAVGNELDIAVDFKAPELPGRYISYWRMGSPSGVKFGQRVWVLIQVTCLHLKLYFPLVRSLLLSNLCDDALKYVNKD